MEGEQVQEQVQEKQLQTEVIEGQQQPQVDPDVERRAKLMGWVPKDDFRGDPERWQPADSFVKRADELMPIMKTQLRRYEDQITTLRNENISTRKTMEKLVAMGEKVTQRAYDQAKADITRQQAEAVSAGDSAKFLQLEADKERLERPEKIEVAQPANSPDAENPMFKTWHGDNDWYLSDPDMTIFANAYAQQYPPPHGTPYTQWLDTIGGAVKKAFPHKFSNPNRARASAVDGGVQRGVGPGRPKSKTYNDLPADAKMQCDKYVGQKLMTKEKYVQEYFEGD